MSNINLIKLGFGGSLSLNESTQFIDDQKIKHKKLKNTKLDLINNGTLRKPDPILVVKNKEDEQDNYVIYSLQKANLESTEKAIKSSEYYIKYPFYGQLNYFQLNSNKYSIEDVPYFQPFLNLSEKIKGLPNQVLSGFNMISGTTNVITPEIHNFHITGVGDHNHHFDFYCRFSFEDNFSNTNSLTGRTFIPNTKSRQLTKILYTPDGNVSDTFVTTENFLKYDLVSYSLKNITGKKSLYTTNFKISGFVSPGQSIPVSTESPKHYYISYPITLDNWSYNGYNVPVKITTAFNDIYSPKTSNSISKINNQLNGLILISTGKNNKSEICYISPHAQSSGLRNTLVLNTSIYKNPFFNANQTGIIASGITVFGSVLGTEYYTKRFPNEAIFPKTGIHLLTGLKELTSGQEDNLINLGGYPSEYNLDENDHIKQETPLKDSLYYKHYHKLYTGAKTISTGTWDGIIPSGVYFNIELVTTELNKKIGTDIPLYIVYTGFGTNDEIDIKTTNYLTRFNIKNNQVSGSSFLFKEDQLEIVGRGKASTPALSLLDAKRNARYNINSKISKILKLYIPEIMVLNKKLRKLIKFKNKL